MIPAEILRTQLNLMIRGLAACQETDSGHPDFGALFCSFHGCFHTRCGEAAFPMVFRGISGNDPILAENGFLLSDWLAARQNSDGSWHETPDTWKGTTVFQLLALAAISHIAAHALNDARARLYRQAIDKAAQWVCQNVSPRAMTTNYVATGAAALALADLAVADNPGWARRARLLARQAVSRINAEGLIEGEGWRDRLFKFIRRSSRAIDMGYGLEMTLACLAIYAAVVPGQPWHDKILSAIQAHLCFIYPDGSFDNSLGSRGYKWTLFGSKTAHGSHAALAFAARTIPQARKALARTVGFLDRCIKNGLVADGPVWDAGAGVSCLYATVTRCCSLALTLAYLDPAEAPEQPTPALPRGITHFRSLNSCVVTDGPWKATISGYGEKLRCQNAVSPDFVYVPGGGAVTYLFHRQWGAIQAATQLDYTPIEPLHIPMPPDPPASFTPRVAIHSADGIATSAHWRKPRLKQMQNQDMTCVRVSGGFLRPDSAGRRLPDRLTMAYTWTRERFSKSYILKLKRPYERVEVIEPILLLKGMNAESARHGIFIAQKNAGLIVRATALSGPWQVIASIDRMYVPLPSLAAVCLICRLDQPAVGAYRVRVDISLDTGKNKDY